MSIVSPSSIDIQNDQLDVTSKGISHNNKTIYLKLSNVAVLFGGDNKQFESNPSKVKKYIKFVPTVANDYKLLQFLSDSNMSKNHWINDVTVTAYINEHTKFYDKNNVELTNVKLMDLKDGRVDLILGGSVFKNKFGTFERLIVRQMRIIEKTDRTSLFDVCQF